MAQECLSWPTSRRRRIRVLLETANSRSDYSGSPALEARKDVEDLLSAMEGRLTKEVEQGILAMRPALVIWGIALGMPPRAARQFADSSTLKLLTRSGITPAP